MDFDNNDSIIANSPFALFSEDAARKNTGIIVSGEGRVATCAVSTAVRNIYLDRFPATGLWAVEFTLSKVLSGSCYSALGIANNLDIDTLVGLTAQGCGWRPHNGAMGHNASTTLSFWDASTATTPKLIMIDCTSRKLYCPKTGVLKASSALTAALYCGVSLFNNTAGNLSVTLNSGQDAFSASNEALLAAYEQANSVTINRGLWL